jgi:hypothetical protein
MGMVNPQKRVMHVSGKGNVELNPYLIYAFEFHKICNSKNQLHYIWKSNILIEKYHSLNQLDIHQPHKEYKPKEKWQIENIKDFEFHKQHCLLFLVVVNQKR